MFWYKHSTGSHDDPDISDAWDELGDFGYVGFFVILEIYGQEFSHRDSEDFINISTTFLRRKLRKSSGKVQLLLDFFQKRNRIISKLNGDRIQLKVPKYIELASNWTKRLPTEVPPEIPTAKEVEVEVEVEKNKNDKKKILLERFEQFWKVYPKKVNKNPCLKKWLIVKPSEELTQQIIEAIEKQIEAGMLNTVEIKYCPDPSTWFNQRRWENEIIEIKNHLKSNKDDEPEMKIFR